MRLENYLVYDKNTKSFILKFYCKKTPSLPLFGKIFYFKNHTFTYY
jgi:hypothetical protein